MPKRAPVDVFAYRDHRAFLAAFHTRASAQNGGFSYADFSKRVGLRSPNYLKLVIDGERNLSVDMAHRFGEACGLSGQSLRFFCSLVAFGQAKTTRERDRHYAELQTFRRFRASHRLDAAQSAYHSQWYIPAIHELCAREDFQDDPRWIGSTLLTGVLAIGLSFGAFLVAARFLPPSRFKDATLFMQVGASVFLIMWTGRIGSVQVVR